MTKNVNGLVILSTCLNVFTDLICHPTVSARIPGDQVLNHFLGPTTVLGTQILSRQTHIPIWTGPQHGQEGHEVTGPVHWEFSWRGCPPKRREWTWGLSESEQFETVNKRVKQRHQLHLNWRVHSNGCNSWRFALHNDLRLCCSP